MAQKPKAKPKAKRTTARPPVIWAYQPTSFEVVTPDRLKIWEAAMIEHVGLSHIPGVDKINIRGATVGTYSFSYSGPTDQAPDDCDMD